MTDSMQTRQTAIRSLIEAYVCSINEGNIDLAGTFWLTGDDASFIHPRGHERGWDEIVGNFYVGTMGELLRDRHLRLDGPATITVHGSSAVVEFDWSFDAFINATGEPLHTQGRESQVWIDMPNKGWRLTHVHYSGPPMTGIGQGF